MKTNTQGKLLSPSAWLTERPIGDALRENYEETLREPIPERLQLLIDQLRAEERSQKE